MVDAVRAGGAVGERIVASTGGGSEMGGRDGEGDAEAPARATGDSVKEWAGWLALTGVTLLIIAAFIKACTPKDPKWDVYVHWVEDQQTGWAHSDWVFLCTDGVHISGDIVVVNRGERGSVFFTRDVALPIKTEPSRYCP